MKINNSLKFTFVSTNQDISVGSYRIWVNDLNEYLSELNYESSIVSEVDYLDENTILILSKADISKLNFYKRKFPKNRIGIINPPGSKKYSADFIIVGSIEEKDSLSMNKNVILFPLIENSYRNISPKVHKDEKRDLVIGFHGSYTHLAKFSPHLRKAIEEFSKDNSIRLRIITAKNSPQWLTGKPSIKKIEYVDWDITTFSKELLECDIGVIPNLSESKSIFQFNSIKKGLYNTDYCFRMKNKSNSGRMFVFMQHGIPCIADLTPSNLHLLGNPNNGFAVHSKEGWLKALTQLRSSKLRNKISQTALENFKTLYDPIEWTKDFIVKIKEIN